MGRLMRKMRREKGAVTAEYSLVILVAATIAPLLLNWAKGGAVADFLETRSKCDNRLGGSRRSRTEGP